MLQSFIEDRSAFPDLTRLWDLTCKGSDSLWKGGLERPDLAEILAAFSLHLREDMGPEEYRARYLEPKGRSLSVMAIERTVLAEVGQGA